jgi:hypothetical protein
LLPYIAHSTVIGVAINFWGDMHHHSCNTTQDLANTLLRHSRMAFFNMMLALPPKNISYIMNILEYLFVPDVSTEA